MAPGAAPDLLEPAAQGAAQEEEARRLRAEPRRGALGPRTVTLNALELLQTPDKRRLILLTVTDIGRARLMTAGRRPRKKTAAPGAAGEACSRRRPGAGGRRGAPAERGGRAAPAGRGAPRRALRRRRRRRRRRLARPEDIDAIVHELRVHQIELEMQNEELRRAQLELDAQREKYFELFDLAPVGYLTLSDEGIVGDANLTAARLLGVERQLLVGQPFSAFVFAPDRDVLYLHQRHAPADGRAAEPASCACGASAAADAERAATPPDHFWARLEGRPQSDGDGEPPSCWVTFSDVDARRSRPRRRSAASTPSSRSACVTRTAAARGGQQGARGVRLLRLARPARPAARHRRLQPDGRRGRRRAPRRRTTCEHLQRVRAAAQRMALLIDDLLGLSRAARQDLLRATRRPERAGGVGARRAARGAARARASSSSSRPA